MATARSNVVAIGSRAASKEVRGRFASELDQRERASNILSPGEVAGEYDAGRLLSTTLDGQLRHLTRADLVRFKRSAEALGKKFKGGITAKSVIDNSTPEDRERSNRQIRVAIPTQRMGAAVHFTTNAGPNSDVTRHHVHVNFLNYDAAVASPSKAAELVKMMTGGHLKFDCDCEHHRYRHRYIATIGRYNAGRAETGYPKITNPNLIGIACKHVLRVMQQLASPAVRVYVERMIEDGRKHVRPKLVATTKKDAKALAEQQEKQASWRRNTVESTAEKSRRLAEQRAVKAIAERGRKAAQGLTAKKKADTVREMERNARRLASFGAISQQMLATILAKLKGK